MKYERETIPSVHCFLDIVHIFIRDVPIEDKEWQNYRADALDAMEIAKYILVPRPDQVDPCKGKPIIRYIKENPLGDLKYSK